MESAARHVHPADQSPGPKHLTSHASTLVLSLRRSDRWLPMYRMRVLVTIRLTGTGTFVIFRGAKPRQHSSSTPQAARQQSRAGAAQRARVRGASAKEGLPLHVGRVPHVPSPTPVVHISVTQLLSSTIWALKGTSASLRLIAAFTKTTSSVSGARPAAPWLPHADDGLREGLQRRGCGQGPGTT